MYGIVKFILTSFFNISYRKKFNEGNLMVWQETSLLQWMWKQFQICKTTSCMTGSQNYSMTKLVIFPVTIQLWNFMQNVCNLFQLGSIKKD